ncbi:DUF547 domain-containing protein [Vibrio hippocampi]|uniref:DUF547 domain-containing protein n=1 Tax=Vibrio hippocampi TaxID=654686 RepID=UPI003F4A78B5
MIGFTLLVTLFTSLSTFAAPKSELWSYWQASNENSTQTVSHQEWQNFLDQYLVIQGEHHLIRYQAVNDQDKTALKSYINHLASMDPRTLTRQEQYAYWVNMYNAITINLILDNYPIKSITKLGGFFSFGPWDLDVITINQKALTLNDIEHRILRPIWNDPRTHYAVNCASLGCPNLQAKALTAENTEALLNTAARQFIQSSKGVELSGNTAKLSSIYEWFSVDFDNEGGVMAHIAKFKPELAQFNGKVEYDYDWALNQE